MGVFHARCYSDGRSLPSTIQIPQTMADIVPFQGGSGSYKCYEDTHQEMIETAVSLISKKGVHAVSIAAVARAMDINRTTVYYHFKSREELLDAVKSWSADQLAKAFSPDRPQHERIDFITRFVLENPELIKLWIEDLLSPGDIRHRYPHWDELVEGIKALATEQSGDDAIDAEVYCVILMTSAIIGPRVFKNSVCPSANTDAIVQRFRGERQRLLKHAGLLRE
jgi:AcrR family transcriptional regulator